MTKEFVWSSGYLFPWALEGLGVLAAAVSLQY